MPSAERSVLASRSPEVTEVSYVSLGPSAATNITLDNIDDLPKRCRRCVFWELAPHLGEQAAEYGNLELEKEAWLSSVLLDWGSCGKIMYVDQVAAGYAMYAPPAAVPRAATFPTGPVGHDAVLLTAVAVLPELTGSGIGRLLVQAVAKDLTRRGVRAIEAFGRMSSSDPEPGQPESHCVIPADFLTSVGFKTVRPHHRWPRLRLELRSGLSWKEDVEAALERLLAEITIPAQTSSPVDAPAIPTAQRAYLHAGKNPDSCW
jgi:ribosomal protein S18 acetylase RimI-like enzyme